MNAAFTGRKRSGKTTLAFDMAMQNDGGIIIYDPKREWRGWPGTVTEVSEIQAKIDDKCSIIVFHPQGDKREAFAPLADFVSELHNYAMLSDWDKLGYHFTFIVDEAVNVSTAQFVDKNLLSLVAENRPEILSIYLTFQSPKDANNLLKSRLSDWFVFNTSLPSDLEYLNKEIGVPAEDLERVQHLAEHEYAHFYFDGGTPSVQFVYDPDSWFRPLEYSEINENERGNYDYMAKESEEREDKELRDAVDIVMERLRKKESGGRSDRRESGGRSGRREDAYEGYRGRRS